MALPLLIPILAKLAAAAFGAGGAGSAASSLAANAGVAAMGHLANRPPGENEGGRGGLGTAALAITGIGAFKAAEKALEHFGASALAAAEPLRRFNGSIAAAFAAIEAQNMVLAVGHAAGTAGTTTAVANQWMALREETADMKAAWANVGNIVAGMGIMLARGLALLANILDPVTMIYRAVAPGSSSAKLPDDMARIMEEMSRGDWRRALNR